MNFLIELFAELFGWIGLGHAGKDFEKGNRKSDGVADPILNNFGWYLCLHNLRHHTIL